MTNLKDRIDWIGAKEAEMREYEEGLRLVKEISQSDEISYIMNNLNSKPLNELRRYIGMKEVEPTRMRKHEEEHKKMKDEKKPETDLIIDRIIRSKQQNRVPSADRIREKLGISQGLADRFEGYCNPDEASKAIREYLEKNGLSDDVPLCNEILEVLENESVSKRIMDNLRKGHLVTKALKVYKLEDGFYSIDLFKVYENLTPMNTYLNDNLGTGNLEDVAHTIIELLQENPDLKLIVEESVSHEIHEFIIKNAIKELEENNA